MKQLILARHTHALDARGQETDLDRRLSPQGQQEATLLGEWLRTQQIFPDKMYVSIAQRTRDTAEIYAKSLNYPTENIIFEPTMYQASLNTLHDLIVNLPLTADLVMFIGHNPTISQLADFLSKTDIQPFPTGGMVLLQFESMHQWADTINHGAEMLWYQIPDKLKS